MPRFGVYARLKATVQGSWGGGELNPKPYPKGPKDPIIRSLGFLRFRIVVM